MKRTKKVLAILLVAIMVVCTLPMTAFAEKIWNERPVFITEAYASVTVPLIGETFTSDVKVPSTEANARIACWWKGGTLQSPGQKMYSGTFEGGYTYYVDVEFSDKGIMGYCLTPETQFYINGQRGVVCYVGGSNSSGNTISARVGFSVSSDRITEMDVTIQTPASDRYSSLIKNNKSGYEATITHWYLSDDFSDLSRTKGVYDNFFADDPYIAEVTFTGISKRFANYPNVLINGSPAYIKEINPTANTVTALVKFKAVRPMNLTYVSADLNRVLRYNYPRDTKVWCQSDKYEIETLYWKSVNSENGLYDYVNSDIDKDENSWFSPGNVYALYIKVIPKDNYGLTDNTCVEIAGNKGHLISADDMLGTRIYRVPFTVLESNKTELTEANVTITNNTKTSNDVSRSIADYDDYIVALKGWWITSETEINLAEVYSEPEKYRAVELNKNFYNQNYVVAIKFTPLYGKAFTTNSVIKINGLEAYCYSYDPEEGSGVYMVVLNKKLNKVSETISSMSAAVVAPVVGEKISYETAVNGFQFNGNAWQENGYAVTVTDWYKNLSYSPEYQIRMTADEKFKQGYNYVANVAFEPLGGNVIAPGADVTINGYVAQFVRQENGRHIYSIGFDAAKITEVNATLNPVTVGSTPDFTAESDSGAYTFTVDNWYMGGTLDSPGVKIYASTAFIDGMNYIAEITATPSNYISNSSLNDTKESGFKINGKSGKIVERDTSGSSDGSVTYRVEFPMAITEVSATVVAPMAGNTPRKNIATALASYTAEVVDWYVGGTVQNPGSKMTETAQYILGQTYIAKVKFTPKDGMQFAASPTGKINGQTAYKSSNTPLTFNVALVAKEQTHWISTVDITDSFAPGGIISNNVTSTTPGVDTAIIGWSRNGQSISDGTALTYGVYSGAVGISAEENYFFTSNTVVNIYGRTITGGFTLFDGRSLFIPLPDFNISCSHIDRTPHHDDDNHWSECDDCGEKFDVAEHSWYIYSTSSSQTTYHCQNCNATKAVDGVCVQEYHITPIPPVVGNKMVDITPKNSIYADQALVTSTDWYSVNLTETNHLPRNFKFTTANRNYYAVITLEAQDNFYFEDSLRIWSSFGWTEAEIIDNKTARAIIEYTATEKKYISVVLPEVSIGRTVEDVLNDFVMSANGSTEDYIVTVSQVGGFSYGILYSASTGMYSTYDTTTSIETMLSTVIRENKTYKISTFAGGGGQYVYESDISVTNDYGADYSLSADAIFYGIDATYETGTGIIDYLEINGIVPPVIGETASTDISVKALGIESVSGHWQDENGNYAFTFESGKQYTLLISLWSRIDRGIGYKFATDVMVNANCNDVTVTGNRAEYFSYIYSVRVTFPPLSANVNVSGLVTSHGGADGDFSVSLLPEGTSEVAYEANVSSGNYSFGVVAAGNYIMRVVMENHITREYAVTVGSDALIQDVELWQIGDVNEDGEIDIRDLVRLKKKAAEATNESHSSADLNQDDVIDAVDATEMKKMLLNK